MDLRQIDTGWAIVALDVDDLATLADLCTAARATLVDVETEPLARLVEAYKAAFQAMALATLGVNIMPPSMQESFLQELADHELAGLVTIPQAIHRKSQPGGAAE